MAARSSWRSIALSRDYLAAGLLPRGSHADALHIAFATTLGADYLVTWNIRHMAAAARRARVRSYNEGRGLKSPEIVTPEELLGAESS
ncbi:MAG: hypothetical protein AABZ30_10650 [Myxococcota bacterium]